MNAYRELNPTNSDVFYIMDARPFSAAFGNSVMGKGFESAISYGKCKMEFLNIGKIKWISLVETYSFIRQCPCHPIKLGKANGSVEIQC